MHMSQALDGLEREHYAHNSACNSTEACGLPCLGLSKYLADSRGRSLYSQTLLAVLVNSMLLVPLNCKAPEPGGRSAGKAALSDGIIACSGRCDTQSAVFKKRCSECLSSHIVMCTQTIMKLDQSGLCIVSASEVDVPAAAVRDEILTSRDIL